MKNHSSLSLTFVVLLTAMACGGGNSGSSETGGSQPAAAPEAQIIAADGSSTVFPVTQAVAEEFQKATPGTKVTVGRSGTGGGFQKFCRGESAVSNASRPITLTEIEACKKAGIDYIELPVAYDGMAIVVNPKNTFATSITVAELKKLWEPAAQGKVVKWNQVRANWPNQEIHLFGAGVDSGTFDYFTEVINGKAKVSRGDYTSSEDDNILVQGVAGDQGALGYMGLAYFEENKDKLKLVPVDDGNPANGDGPIAPTPETVRDGTYRPLSRPIFIYVSTAALARTEVAKFVQYYLESSAPLIKEVGYVPLTEAEQKLVLQRFTNRTTGTMFDASAPTDPKISLEQRLSGQAK
ncbi:MAG TPA: PstS family phosphate ABC transporter substrate-binding protein [Vicinamibacterales bacterium]|nr:PstS family phosphate ABC transporter substrate-binding protein [Vicinamibacterales bacterium]